MSKTTVASAVRNQGVSLATTEMTVIRADGTVERYGVVGYWHPNPIRRWAVNLFIGLRTRYRTWKAERNRRG